MQLTLLLALAAPQTADVARYQFGTETGAETGRAVATVGDFDDDGIADYAVGTPRATIDGVFGLWPDHGFVRVYSGADGSEIANTALAFPNGNSLLGTAIAGGFDTDGDGKRELAATVEGLDQVSIFEQASTDGGPLFEIATLSGADTATIRFQDFGRVLANVGDVTGDGVDDLAIGAPGSDLLSGGFFSSFNAGAVQVVSGATWTVTGTLVGPNNLDRFGSALASVPDRNNDGGRELVVGAPGEMIGDSSGPYTFGHVRVFDANGFFGAFELATFTGSVPGDGFGVSVVMLDDVDSSGDVELGIASSWTNSPSGPGFSPRFEVRRFEDAGLVSAYQTSNFNPPLARALAASDVDGDGRAELLILDSVDTDSSDEVLAIDPLTGAVDGRFPAWPVFSTDAALAGGLDFDADGREDFVLGLSRHEDFRGAALGYRLDPGDASPPAPNLWTVDDDALAGADFLALSEAALIAQAGDRVQVGPGSYGPVEIYRDLTVHADIFGTTVAALGAFDLDRLHLEGLSAESLELERIDGRVTLSELNLGRAEVIDCGDVTVVDCQLGLTANNSRPTFEVLDSTVQVRSSTLVGTTPTSTTAPGQSALAVRGAGRLWSVASTYTAGDSGTIQGMALAGRPAIELEGTSELDLRGGPTHAVEGGLDGNGVPSTAIRVEFGAACRLSPTLPPISVDGPGGIELALSQSPWLEFPGTARLGTTLTAGLFATAGDVGAVVLALDPAQLALPQVVHTLLWLDPATDLATSLETGQGPTSPAIEAWPVPPNPALAGLEVQLQGFVLRPLDFLFDGTNGGAILLR